MEFKTEGRMSECPTRSAGGDSTPSKSTGRKEQAASQAPRFRETKLCGRTRPYGGPAGSKTQPQCRGGMTGCVLQQVPGVSRKDEGPR